jgi:divalent metal cation (Fe/Co/Zn/Cd) transporter
MTSPHRTQIAERVKHRIAEALGASEVVVHVEPA